MALGVLTACSRMDLPRVADHPADWWKDPSAQKPGRIAGSVRVFDLTAMCRELGDLPESLTVDAWAKLNAHWRALSPQSAARGEFERAYTVAIQRTRSEVTRLLRNHYQYKRARDFKWVTSPLGRADRAEIELRHLTEVIIDRQDDPSADHICGRALLGFVYSEWIRAVDPLSRWVDSVAPVAAAQVEKPEFSWRWVHRAFGEALVFHWGADWNGDWSESADDRLALLLEELAEVKGPIQWVWDLRDMPIGAQAPELEDALETVARPMRGWVWLAPRAVPPYWLIEWARTRPLAYARQICETTIDGLFLGKKWVLSCGPALKALPVPELKATDPWTESLAVELTRTREIP